MYFVTIPINKINVAGKKTKKQQQQKKRKQLSVHLLHLHDIILGTEVLNKDTDHLRLTKNESTSSVAYNGRRNTQITHTRQNSPIRTHIYSHLPKNSMQGCHGP